MFFPERIQSIKSTDRVLEIGPGGSPYQRSDVFLELNYDDEQEAEIQRSFSEPLKTDKQIVNYDGDIFPFADGEFDYVVASHVLEHVPDVPFFLGEINRVAKRGYIEFPTIYYEYLYNIVTHVNLLMSQDGIICYLKKADTAMPEFAAVQSFFYKCLCSGYSGDIRHFKNLYFNGFEWTGALECKQAYGIVDIVYGKELVIPAKQRCMNNLSSKIKRLFR